MVPERALDLNRAYNELGQLGALQHIVGTRECTSHNSLRQVSSTGHNTTASYGLYGPVRSS